VGRILYYYVTTPVMSEHRGVDVPPIMTRMRRHSSDDTTYHNQRRSVNSDKANES